MNPVIAALLTIVDTLTQRQTPYAVMGGLAVRVHALPRPTQDVDLTIALARAALPDWYQQLEQVGITIPEQYRSGWIDQIAEMPLIKLKIYLEPSHGIDLDVFLAESEFQRSLIARRQPVVLDDRSIDIVSPEDLLLLKLIANRPRDLLDVADILFIQGQLDQSYLDHWAAQLGVTERLQQAQSDQSPYSDSN